MSAGPGAAAPLEALPALFKAVGTQPRDPRLRRALAAALDGFPLESAGESVRRVLLELAHDDDIATQCLVDAVAGLTLASPAFGRLWSSPDLAAARELAREPLLQAILARAIVTDPAIEQLLTLLRRAVLLDGIALDPAFLRALALQGFNNEYAWFVTPEEAAALAALAPDSPARALYQPGAEQLRQLEEEAGLARSLEAITPIRGGVSREVREMYEANPYPRWINLLRPEPLPRTPASPRTILVAGGGTGQHTLHTALRHPDAEILAVDLSRASLAYAMRMAGRYGVANVRFAQADILELGALGRRFDRIESVGVLHHLEDPLAGWRVLTGLLAEGGTMRIGLYSTLARAALQPARELARQRAFAGTPDGIRACRRAILELPEDYPARAAMESDDFYSLSGCRDLIMHVQEHSYTLPQLADALMDLGLKFSGFESAPAILAPFRAANPDPAALTDLGAWHRFETRRPELFRGMYQFTCTRS